MSILRRYPHTRLVPHFSAVFTAFVVSCISLPADFALADAAIQPLDSIRTTAEKFVIAELPKSIEVSRRKVIATAGYLDSRLRLPACDGNLTAARPQGSVLTARNTIGVTCPSGNEWTVYVPVTLESETTVLVTRRAAARGANLTAEDVEERTQLVPGIASNYVADPAKLAGMHAKRAIPAGTALTADVLAPNLLIKRGQQVTLLAAVGGIEVRASGRALTEGGAADRIRVQNLNSTRVVEGFVESADIVRIAP